MSTEEYYIVLMSVYGLAVIVLGYATWVITRKEKQ